MFGHEHFVERLQTLSCAGAPIRDPISGNVVGLIDVTCWRSDGSLLMSALVKQAACDIEGRLFELSCERERALLQEFLATCRHTNRPVLSLSNDLTITNVSAAHLLDPDDHTVLREKAVELAGSSKELADDVVLSRGQLARLRCRPVSSQSGIAGAIIEIQVTDEYVPIRGGAVPQPGAASLLGLAGQSSAWLRVCWEMDVHSRGRSWLLLIGEPGVGKAALAQAAHRQSFSDARLSIVDAADCRGDGIEGWLAELNGRLHEAGGTVVLRHLDQLGPVAVGKLADVLDEVGSGAARPWVVALSSRPRPSVGSSRSSLSGSRRRSRSRRYGTALAMCRTWCLRSSSGTRPRRPWSASRR